MPPKNKLNIKDRCEDGELDLSMLDLHEVPVKEIATVKKATSLDLSNNRLTILGSKFVTLTHIIKLDLSKNQITELPEDFGKMTQLKHLDLYSNKLTHLPLSFAELRNLRWLDLKNNPLVPAVERAVGPCLDQQQCLQAAKQAVKLMAEMNAKVEEERERQRQKQQLEHEKELERERQQRKRNERKKAARLRKKEIRRDTETVSAGGDSEPQNDDEKIVPSVESITTEKINRKTKRGWFKWILILLSIWMITASVRWSSDIRTGISNVWSVHISHLLPVDIVLWFERFGETLSNLHQTTGESVHKVIISVRQAADSQQVKQAMEMASTTLDMVRNKSAELCTSLHHVTVSLLDEIKKRTT